MSVFPPCYYGGVLILACFVAGIMIVLPFSRLVRFLPLLLFPVSRYRWYVVVCFVLFFRKSTPSWFVYAHCLFVRCKVGLQGRGELCLSLYTSAGLSVTFPIFKLRIY